MLTGKIQYLYALENWGGIFAAAFWQETAPGRMEPKWKDNISRAEWVRLSNLYAPFEDADQGCQSIVFYDLDAQREAVGDYVDALDERNDMAAAAAQGVL